MGRTKREWLHVYADLVGEEELEIAYRFLQKMAAVELNRRCKADKMGQRENENTNE